VDQTFPNRQEPANPITRRVLRDLLTVAWTIDTNPLGPALVMAINDELLVRESAKAHLGTALTNLAVRVASLRDGAGSMGEFAGSFWEKPTLNSFESGWEIYKPVIAAVNGHCLGYGLTLVTWCDFVLASDRARFGYPEAVLGIPAMVGAVRLPQKIAWADAMELLMTGEPVDAERARQIGLVWRVVAHEELMAEARDLAGRLVRGAPLAQRAMKEMAMRAPHLSSPEAIRMGEAMRLAVASTDDAAEGMRAAAEGRTPQWRGR